MNLFRHIPQLRPFVNDLSSVNKSIQHLRIHGNAQSLERLSSLKNLKSLSVYTLNQQQFETICRHANPEKIKLYELRANNLAPLTLLTDIKEIELDWNTKATTLWDLSGNPALHKLSINDFSKLSDISYLQNARNITELSLTGGIWNKLKLHSLSPLKSLDSLNKLTLANLSLEQGGLEPITHLHNLKELTVSNQFPTEEYARLSVALPNTKCQYFAPYVTVKGIYSDKDIMPVGKGKPWLNSTKDKAKLEKLTANFAALQARYRNEYSND